MQHFVEFSNMEEKGISTSLFYVVDFENNR